ncbi:hypothetical protein [Telluria aromaticivorans]|uniref:Uncharacterized protein n=1 Tax=Telluria aromaticivorans TaxID=2725995 RepID=A0A7Y2JYU8_9BURK|nr:hypothetical protein [Telluria aromaticivorans]NNG23512.1 hypothetical protein [Telluria aromaticivorans]
MFGHTFVANVVFISALVFLFRAYDQDQASSKRWVLVLNSVFSRNHFPLFAVLLLTLAWTRANYMKIENGPWEVEVSTIAPDSTAETPFSIASPIELIYSDSERLTEVYSQIRGDMKITEKKFSRKATGEAKAGGNAGVVDFEGKVGGESEQSSTFAAVDPSNAQNVIRIIEHLYKEKRLLPVRSIEIQSPELNELDRAVRLLDNTYKIPLSANLIEARRRAIIEQNLKVSAPNEFTQGSWVVVQGMNHISRPAKNISLSFDYVPSLPGRARFRCDIPTPLSGAGSVLKNEKTLEAKIFGKIRHVKSTPAGIEYTLSCYAIYV